METEAKHTPLPWTAFRERFHNTPGVKGPDDTVCVFHYQYDEARIEYPNTGANVEFIVRACNSHYELLEAAEQAYGALVGSHAAEDSVQGRNRQGNQTHNLKRTESQ